MSDGAVVVNLQELDDFNSRARNVRDNYHKVTNVLTDADVSDAAKRAKLESDPGFGHGGPADFYQLSKDFLSKYAEHVHKIQQVHAVTAQRLDFMVQQLVESHQLYSEVETKNAALFTDILRSFPGGAKGDDHGAS